MARRWLQGGYVRLSVVRGSRFEAHKHSEYNPPIPASLGVVWGHPGTTLVPPYTHRRSQKPHFQSAKLIQPTFLRRFRSEALFGSGC